MTGRRTTPTERLARADVLAKDCGEFSDDAHDELYDLLAGAATDRPVPAADRDTGTGRGEEAA